MTQYLIERDIAGAGAMRLRRSSAAIVLVLSALVLSAACSSFTGGGTPCGGQRRVEADAVLPDTGLGARGTATVAFNESDPLGMLDETSLIVWTFPPANTTFADNPPRVRLLTTDGRVLLDQDASTAYLGSWYARAPIPNGPVRDEIVAAFQAGTVLVEYSALSPTARLTQVQPTVRFAGRTPVLQCM